VKDSIRSIPEDYVGWLKRGVLGKILYVIGLHFDFLIEWAQVAIWSRFPGYYSDETLPLHARARQLDQGIGETNAQFATRLETYIAAHSTRGNPYALLREVFAHYRYSADGPFPAHLYYTSGRHYEMDAQGVVTMADDTTFTTGIEDWAHWYLVYEWPTALADDGTWDDEGDWDTTPDGAWDTTAPYSFIADARLIPSKWNAAHCIGHLTLLGPGQALWDIPDEDWDSEEEWDAGGDADLVDIVIL
jgi:hypothetical protein